MIRKVLAIAVAAAFMTASGGASAYVGGNTVPTYPAGPPASKNKTHTKHGVGGNFVPVYGATEASKNKKVTKDGVGGNFVPTYPVTATKP
jgi:hypothetical protein